MKTGAELKARREELKITQQDLADKIGVSRTQLSRMENGKIEIPIEIRPVLYDSLYAKDEKPKLQFSDLEVGDYVYVRDDLVEFKDYGCTYYVDEICSGIQQIESFHSEDSLFITNKSHYWVAPEMIDLSRSMKKEDYLKMNEKEDVSFYDLVDLATKAFKCGFIIDYYVSDQGMDILVDKEEFRRKFRKNRDDIKVFIDRIQSLYTEEFAIEKISDELRLKSGAELTLSNGIKCVYFDDGEKKLRHDGDYYPCNFLILKGATVKQKKS